MVDVSAVVLSPSGAAPSGLSPRWRSVRPWLATQAEIPLALHFVLLRSQPHIRSAKCHLVPRCHCSLTLVWLWLSPLVPRSDSPQPNFATVRIYLSSFGRILPRSSVGLASLALGTIGLVPRHDCVCACDFLSSSLISF